MSYIRPSSVYKYVEGRNFGDYVFETGDKRGSWIKDYGSISNESIIEILFRMGEHQNSLILKQLAFRLSENLKVKLRKKPLTDKQCFKESMKIVKEFEKEWEDKTPSQRENKK